MAASWLYVKLRAGLSQVIENGQGKGIVQVVGESSFGSVAVIPMGEAPKGS